MKKTILVLAALSFTAFAFGQGSVTTGTFVPSSGSGTVNAPVYGVDENDSSLSWQGATPPGGYVGSKVGGAGFTAELWGGPAGTDAGSLVFVSSSTLFASSAPQGCVFPSVVVSVPGVPGGSLATFQLRAYDNAGGTITSWAQVNPAVNPSGVSLPFTLTRVLGGAGSPPGTPPNLEGLTSFNLSIVPEPSAIALGVLGLGALVLFRRRKN